MTCSVGGQDEILHCDWLPDQAKWSDDAHWGLSILFSQSNFTKVQVGACKLFFAKINIFRVSNKKNKK